MKKTVFKPSTTTIIHIAAGQTVDAIVHNGKAYIEYPTPEGLTAGGSDDADEDDAPETTTAKTKVEETASKARASKKVEDAERKEEAAKKSTSKLYTEAELMDVAKFPVKKLMEILDEMGVEIPAEGKNTNKKLRVLILENQTEGSDEEEEDEAPVKKSASKTTTKASAKVEEDEEEEDEEEVLTDIFTRLEEEEIDEKAAVKELIAFGYEKEDATEMVDEFLDGEDTVEDFVASILEDEDDDAEEEEEEEAPAPAKRGAKKAEPATTKKAAAKKSEGKEVEISDLKAGDKVSVYFESEEAFVKGEVSSAKRGKVTVAFEDDTEEILDAEENTKILLLS